MGNSYLLDTNALSEGTKPKPNQGFIQWLNQANQFDLWTSCMAIGEMQKGLELIKNKPRYDTLATYFMGLKDGFEGRIFLVDMDTVMIWARLTAQAQLQGNVLTMVDGLIAAQALQHDATLVTRNIKDFKQIAGLKLCNPWQYSAPL